MDHNTNCSTQQDLGTNIGLQQHVGVIETLTLDPMTGIFCPLVSCLLLPRLVNIPYPHIYIRPQELRQGLLNSADGVLSLIPILPQIDKDA